MKEVKVCEIMQITPGGAILMKDIFSCNYVHKNCPFSAISKGSDGVLRMSYILGMEKWLCYSNQSLTSGSDF